jgi:hypothetical protein
MTLWRARLDPSLTSWSWTIRSSDVSGSVLLKRLAVNHLSEIVRRAAERQCIVIAGERGPRRRMSPLPLQVR